MTKYKASKALNTSGTQINHLIRKGLLKVNKGGGIDQIEIDRYKEWSKINSIISLILSSSDDFQKVFKGSLDNRLTREEAISKLIDVDNHLKRMKHLYKELSDEINNYLVLNNYS